MSLSPVAFIAPNYRDYKGWWLKFYSAGTTTPKTIILNSGGTTSSAAKLQLNKDGFITSSGGTIVVPYITGAYDAYLFPTAIEADANNTAQAVRVADGLTNELASSVVVFDNVAEMKAAALNVGQTAMCKRYYANGELVDGLVYEVQGNQVVDGFSDHALTNGNTAVLSSLDNLSPEKCGADESISNNTTYFNAMFSASHKFKKITMKRDATYNFTGIVSSTDKNLTVDANNATMSFSSGYLLNQGSIESPTTITANVQKGVNIINVASSSGLSVGDTVIIWNPAAFSFCLHRDFYRDGEFNKITSISGNTITLNNPTRSIYNSSDSVRVYKMNGIKVDIKDLTVVGNSSTTDAWRIRLSDYFRLENCNAFSGFDNAIRLDRCYDGIISGGLYYCSSPAVALQYGLFCGNTQKLTLKNVEFYGTRHGFATGGQADDGSVPNRDLTLIDCEANSDLFWAFDTHGNTENCRFINCNTSMGVGMAGVDVYVDGGEISREDGEAPIQIGEIVGGDYSVKNVRLKTSAIAPFRPNNSALLPLANRNTYFSFENILVEGSGICESMALISFAFPDTIEWNVYANNISFKQFVPNQVIALNKLVRDVGDTKFPSDVIIRNIKGVDNTSKYVSLTGSWSGALTKFYLPSVSLKTTVSISNGEIQGSEVLTSFPSYPQTPCVVSSATGPAFANTIATSALVSSVSTGSFNLRLVVSDSAAPVGADQTRVILSNVSFDGLTI